MRDHRRKGPSPEPEVFDSVLGKIAQALEPTTEADPVGILATLLSGVSGMGGNGSSSPSRRQRPPTAGLLLCGRTGSGRKGTAADAARRVLARADPAFWRENILSGLSSAEGLVTAVADPLDDAEATDFGGIVGGPQSGEAGSCRGPHRAFGAPAGEGGAENSLLDCRAPRAAARRNPASLGGAGTAASLAGDRRPGART
jgi:hypothetical protein